MEHPIVAFLALRCSISAPRYYVEGSQRRSVDRENRLPIFPQAWNDADIKAAHVTGWEASVLLNPTVKIRGQVRVLYPPVGPQ